MQSMFMFPVREHVAVLKSGILLLVTKYTVFLSGIIELSLLLISISVDWWIILLSFSEFEGFKDILDRLSFLLPLEI